MALSGITYGTTNNPYISSRLTWSASQNIAANTSTVTVKVAYWRTNTGYTTWGQCEGTVTVGGVTKHYSNPITMSGSTEATASTAAELTFTVSHDASGKASPSFSVTGGISGTSFTSVNLTGTMALTDIPRATVPTLSKAAADIGEGIVIYLPRAVSSYTHTLSWSVSGGSDTVIGTAIGTSAAWTVPTSLLSVCSASESVTVTIKAETFSGSTSLGSKTVSLTARVPASEKPAAAAGWYTVTHTGESAAVTSWNVPIQRKTHTSVLFDSTRVTVPTGTALQSFFVTWEGQTYTGSSVSLPVFARAGDTVLQLKVTDSRGRSYSENLTLSVYPYASPGLSSVSLYRCDSLGIEDGEGTGLFAAASAELSSVGGRNTGTMTVSLVGESSPEETLTEPTGQVCFAGLLSLTRTYTARLTLTDALGGTAVFDAVIPTAGVAMHIREGGQGAAFGCYAQQDNVLYTDWDIKTGGSFYQQGKPLRPVHDRGDSGIWHYIRYEDGWGECWGVYSGTESIQSSLSGWYFSILEIGYPFSFLANTKPYLSAEGGSNDALNLARPFNANLTDKASVILWAPVSQSNKSITLRLYAAGKWK